MTDQRVPTEAELELVAGVCNKFEDHVFIEDGDLIWMGSGLFDPLHNSNDLDALVRAMQAAGWFIQRNHIRSGCFVIVHLLSDASIFIRKEAPTDRYATTFACIDALAAEAEKEKK